MEKLSLFWKCIIVFILGAALIAGAIALINIILPIGVFLLILGIGFMLGDLFVLIYAFVEDKF